MGPLAGIRVLELCSFISGPYAGMLLADLGADVVKVELPGVGDPFRKVIDGVPDIGSSFAAFNRGKKSLSCDLSVPEGREVVLRLARTADVLIENFRPGTLERYGLGWVALHETNPRLVYCAITGFGSTGPYRNRPSYDAVGQALSGFWSQITELDNPQALGPAMSDQLTGVFGAYGVLGALVSRSTSGAGQRLETSQLATGLAFMAWPITLYLMDGTTTDHTTRAHSSLSFAFVASDRLPLAVHLSSPTKFWVSLTDAIGRPELREDPRFATLEKRRGNYAALRDTLQDTIRNRSRPEWLKLLERADVPVAPINDVPEALADPQTTHLEMVRRFGEGDRALDLVGFPVIYGTTPSAPGLPPPQLGEHTDALLTEVGYSVGEIDALRAAKVI